MFMKKKKEAKKKAEEKVESQDFIQTLRGTWYQVYFKGFAYEFKFHPERSIEDNIEALEYLLKHAKEALVAEKAKKCECIEDVEA